MQYAPPTERGRKTEREGERENQPRRLERKLTTPSLFFFDVNFIATSRLFTDKLVPAPDSECRLSGLPGPNEATPKTEIRRDTRRRRQSKRSRYRYATTLLSLFLYVPLSFSPRPSCLLLLPLSSRISYTRHSSSIISPFDARFHANSRPRRYSFSSIFTL